MMSDVLDKAFGIHAQALALRARRTEVLAANIANADTPNYKAQDFDFETALATARGDTVTLALTHPRHIGSSNAGGPRGAELVFRTQQQPSLDGNTVDLQFEQAAFARNAFEYQASLTFLSRRIQGLLSAIKGE